MDRLLMKFKLTLGTVMAALGLIVFFGAIFAIGYANLTGMEMN